MTKMPDPYYTLLEQLQTLDFVLVELTLYLDTHPDDLKAIEQYNQTSQQRSHIQAEFEAQFGPLTNGSYSRFPWEWSKAPWPWQV